MTISHILNRAVKTVKSNSPEILTALSVTGVVTTAYLTAQATFKAAKLIETDKSYTWDPQHPGDRKEQLKHDAKLVWRFYVPAGISGAVTIGCIIASKHSSGRRTSAAVAAYSLGERAFSEYREKVVEQIGEAKEQKIRDEIAQSKVDQNPPSSELVIVGTGHVLCCELYTGRYFRSDMETLRRAQNDINARNMREHYVSLNEFYDLVGLSSTSKSDIMGWNFERNLELRFSTCLAPDGEPCLAFEYNYVKML